MYYFRKKRVIRYVVTALAFALTLSLAACNSANDEKSETGSGGYDPVPYFTAMPSDDMPDNVPASVSVGDLVQFGGFEWRVLELKDGKALILTEDIIAERPYNEKLKSVTWEKCTLREYVNGEFLQSLTGDGQGRIVETKVSNPDNLWFGTPGGADTYDKAFLLSLEESDKYFGDSGDYVNKIRWVFDYDKNELIEDSDGMLLSNEFNEDRKAFSDNRLRIVAWWYWLRSPGGSSDRAAHTMGSVDVRGPQVNVEVGGVRPALWLELE